MKSEISETYVSIASVAVDVALAHEDIKIHAVQDKWLEGSDEWTTVYTIDFVRQLAIAIEVDWQVLLAGIVAG